MNSRQRSIRDIAAIDMSFLEDEKIEKAWLLNIPPTYQQSVGNDEDNYLHLHSPYNNPKQLTINAALSTAAPVLLFAALALLIPVSTGRLSQPYPFWFAPYLYFLFINSLIATLAGVYWYRPQSQVCCVAPPAEWKHVVSIVMVGVALVSFALNGLGLLFYYVSIWDAENRSRCGG